MLASHIAREDSIVTRLFTGMLRTSVEYTCKAPGCASAPQPQPRPSYTPFTQLTLALPETALTTVYVMLQRLTLDVQARRRRAGGTVAARRLRLDSRESLAEWAGPATFHAGGGGDIVGMPASPMPAATGDKAQKRGPPVDAAPYVCYQFRFRASDCSLSRVLDAVSRDSGIPSDRLMYSTDVATSGLLKRDVLGLHEAPVGRGNASSGPGSLPFLSLPVDHYMAPSTPDPSDPSDVGWMQDIDMFEQPSPQPPSPPAGAAAPRPRRVVYNSRLILAFTGGRGGGLIEEGARGYCDVPLDTTVAEARLALARLVAPRLNWAAFRVVAGEWLRADPMSPAATAGAPHASVAVRLPPPSSTAGGGESGGDVSDDLALGVLAARLPVLVEFLPPSELAGKTGGAGAFDRVRYMWLPAGDDDAGGGCLAACAGVGMLMSRLIVPWRGPWAGLLRPQKRQDEMKRHHVFANVE